MKPRRSQNHRAVDIDPQLFWGAIVHKQETDDVSLSSIGRKLGLTPATFTRLSYAAWGIQPHYRPDLRTYISLCWWLGREPGDFVKWPEGTQPGTKKEGQ